jgi:TRAP-type transport system periplasmic protein
MKRKGLLILGMCIILILAFTVLGCGPSTPSAPAPSQQGQPAPAQQSQAEPIKLVFASWEGTTAINFDNFTQLGKDLETKTNGKVKVEFAWGAILGAPAEHFNLVRTGQADFAYWNYLFTSGQQPMGEVAGMPITGNITVEQLSQGLWELNKKGYFDTELKGVKPIAIFTTASNNIQMAKSAVRTLDDLKGKKIRAMGPQQPLLQQLGVVPVSLAAPDVYMSLQKGVVDGTFMPYTAVHSFKLSEVVKYFTEVGIGSTDFGVAMNINSYNKLPPEGKAVIDDYIANATLQKKAAIAEASQIPMGQKELKDAGSEIIKLNADELNKLKNSLGPVWNNWIADGQAKGLPRKAMTDDLYNILKNMGIDTPFYGYTPGK